MSSLPDFSSIQALVFDLMGTCVDWHSSITPLLLSSPAVSSLPASSFPSFALDWRSGFFAEIHRRFEQGLGTEDIDLTHRRVLDALLVERGVGMEDWGEEIREKLVKAWPDSIEGIGRLKDKFILAVLANGTTRLQLDIVRTSKLSFHTLFSSQLFNLTKPDPKMYLKGLELLAVEPSQALMVAAHAYDLRAAAKVGMKTIYIHRKTEDPEEDMEKLKREFDWFIDGTKGDGKDGLVVLAELLGA